MRRPTVEGEEVVGQAGGRAGAGEEDSAAPVDVEGSADRRRAPVVTFALALTAVMAAGAVLLVVRDRPGASKAAQFEQPFPDEYVGAVWFTLSAGDDEPRQVTVRWQRLRRAFEHRRAQPVTYVVMKGAGKERSEPLQVDVKPAADVSFNFGKPPDGSVDLSSEPWEALPYSSGVAPPRPANADSRTATAAVDETVSYGGRDGAGIGLRRSPELAAERVAILNQGEVHTALCWRKGQLMTNSNWSDPADDAAAYTSDIWWYIDTPAGKGFIADVWFARRGSADKLNLPECSPEPA